MQFNISLLIETTLVTIAAILAIRLLSASFISRTAWLVSPGIFVAAALYYRYPDMTAIAEALFGFIQITIEKEIVEELNFLKNYDVTKRAIQEIIDMPDQRIDLFIRFCLQNNGVILPKKRKSHFSELTDDEIEKTQTAIQKTYH